MKDASSRQLLISSLFVFYAPEELKTEFERYRDELLSKSKLDEYNFDFVVKFLLKKIHFISLDDFNVAESMAKKIMKDIDPKDSPFLAVGIALNLSGIWSEDIHFTKQTTLPVFSNKMLFEIYYRNQNRVT